MGKRKKDKNQKRRDPKKTKTGKQKGNQKKNRKRKKMKKVLNKHDLHGRECESVSMHGCASRVPKENRYWINLFNKQSRRKAKFGPSSLHAVSISRTLACSSCLRLCSSFDLFLRRSSSCCSSAACFAA